MSRRDWAYMWIVILLIAGLLYIGRAGSEIRKAERERERLKKIYPGWESQPTPPPVIANPH